MSEDSQACLRGTYLANGTSDYTRQGRNELVSMDLDSSCNASPQERTRFFSPNLLNSRGFNSPSVAGPAHTSPGSPVRARKPKKMQALCHNDLVAATTCPGGSYIKEDRKLRQPCGRLAGEPLHLMGLPYDA
ncbi:unnamed protein product, partial [Amoebophrya sp. A25]|eukprot:GSA25T00025196001.1